MTMGLFVSITPEKQALKCLAVCFEWGLLISTIFCCDWFLLHQCILKLLHDSFGCLKIKQKALLVKRC